jgi:pimeloyl-ACP methyl ester carboxylesterase
MTTARDATLARLASAAYSDAATPLPTGFTPLPPSALALAPGAGVSFVDGVYRNQNAAALVATGPLNGVQTLVLAFRGSDDREDSINSLRDINADYADFAPLVAALDNYVASNGVTNVAVTGHSLGGAMTQLYMSQHANGATQYNAATFGSPGALISDATDARIIDYVIAGDPAVYLGENRASVGAELRANPLLAGAAAFTAADTFPGLTPADALASLPSLTRDYENRGITALLPSLDGSLDQVSDFGELLRADPANHRVEVYTFKLASEAAGTPGEPSMPFVSISRGGVISRELATAFVDVAKGTQYRVVGSDREDRVAATDFNDLIETGAGNDRVAGRGGNDFILGGDGFDTAVFRGKRSEYVISNQADGTKRVQDTVANRDGIDTLVDVENLQFANVPTFRFFHTQAGGHLFTTSAVEAASVRANLPVYRDEGTTFLTADEGLAGAVPVFRFFHTQAGGHLFTTSAVEAASVRANLPVYRDEGTAFSMSASPGEGLAPIYRFFHTQAGGHLFTASEVEAASVRANLPVYRDEGIAFYAPTRVADELFG